MGYLTLESPQEPRPVRKVREVRYKKKEEKVSWCGGDPVARFVARRGEMSSDTIHT